MVIGDASFLNQLLDRLDAGFASVRDVLNGIWPPVVAIIVLVVLLHWLRNGLLAWRSRSPRVQVSSFTWANSDGAHQEAPWVTSLFREQLAGLRLDALDPLPERAPGAPLVEIVEGVGQGVGRDIAAAVGRLYKAVWPDSAYEVWGSLRPHPDGGGRIAVQLIERRHGNRTLLNVALDEGNWEDGAREAALAVAGALYPRVRKRDRGPWALWQKTVPREVVRAYHDARRYEGEHGLEYALEAYETALETDPLNPNLRLKIAMLQERLELDLDAWVTYEAIVDELNPRAWRGPNRRVYLLALYRIAVILTNGRIPEQWIEGPAVPDAKGCKRDLEREDRRGELRMSLQRDSLFENHVPSDPPPVEERAWPQQIFSRPAQELLKALWQIETETRPATETPDPTGPLAPFGPPRNAEEKQRREEEGQKQEKQIEAVLQILAMRRLEELQAALAMKKPRAGTWKETWNRRPKLRHLLRRRELSMAAVRVSKLLVSTRIAASFEKRLEYWPPGAEEGRKRTGWLEQVRSGHRDLITRWPFPTSRSRKALRLISPRRRLAERREDSWQLHYNAACATASVLRHDSPFSTFQKERTRQEQPLTEAQIETLDPVPEGLEEEEIVRRSIAELEEYAFRAGSDRLAAQAERVAFDDPDLSGLRPQPAFRLWAGHHLPPRLPDHEPSRESDIKRFTIRVMQEGASIFATAWRERAAEPGPRAAELVRRWQAETEIWKALGQVCREHLSWEERLKWLELLKNRLRSEGVQEVNFSHKDRVARDSMSAQLLEELAQLAVGGVGNGAGSATASTDVHAWAYERLTNVRHHYEAGEERADNSGKLREKAERGEALRAARVWTHLSLLLEKELARDKPSVEKLREELRELRKQLS